MLTIAVDSGGLSRAILDLKATDPQARKALNSTMNKMAAWVRTRSVRGLSDTVKIQQKILRARVRTYRMQGSIGQAQVDGSMKVWFGLNAVPWAKLNPRATRKGGVSAAGGRHDSEAFIAHYGGRPQVLKLIGKERVPLMVMKAEIAQESENYIEHFVLASAEFDNQFLKTFERELKWRTSTRR